MIPFLGQRWPLGHGEGAGPQGGPRSPRSQCCTSPSDGAPGAVVGSSSGAAPPFWPRSGSHSPWRLSPSSWPAWCNSSVFPRGASVCPCQACGRTRPEPAPAQPPSPSLPSWLAVPEGRPHDSAALCAAGLDGAASAGTPLPRGCGRQCILPMAWRGPELRDSRSPSRTSQLRFPWECVKACRGGPLMPTNTAPGAPVPRGAPWVASGGPLRSGETDTCVVGSSFTSCSQIRRTAVLASRRCVSAHTLFTRPRPCRSREGHSGAPRGVAGTRPHLPAAPP